MQILFLSMLLFAASPFDWNNVLEVPPGTKYVRGSQILHFKSKNRPYQESPTAVTFVKTHLEGAKELHSDAEVLRYGSDHVTLNGVYLEMGTCTGKTTNFIAALNPHQRVYTFDSFKGLPEAWQRQDRTFEKGTFAFKNPKELPPVLHNVKIIPGWFKDTLPTFKRDILQGTPIAFLHIDSDIYSSAKKALTILGDNIRPGTVIVFDELYNYPGYENHEWKALQEFLKEKRLSARYPAFNAYHEQVVVIIEKGARLNPKELDL